MSRVKFVNRCIEMCHRKNSERFYKGMIERLVPRVSININYDTSGVVFV